MTTIIFILISILVLLGLLFISQSIPFLKGYLGEAIIRKQLKTLNPDEFKIINNLRLPFPNYISQIDHLIISRHGIFVIETKNYQGLIFGKEDDKYWTQTIFHYSTQFYSPIKQNEGHIKALKRHLKAFHNIQYYSIVIFINAANLYVRTKTPVLYHNQLIPYIESFQELKLTTEVRDYIYQHLISINGKKYYEVPFIDSDVLKALEIKLCPLCSSPLNEKKGRYGLFIGCSNYPNCKYTSNIIVE